MAKSGIVALALAAVGAGALAWRHPLLRYATQQALEQELAGARGGL